MMPSFLSSLRQRWRFPNRSGGSNSGGISGNYWQNPGAYLLYNSQMGMSKAMWKFIIGLTTVKKFRAYYPIWQEEI
jgi:hypothetical protein